MNNWLNKLERKYGRFGIPNLTNILVAGQILVFAIELFIDRTITAWVGLNRFFLLQGQIWRAITFVFKRVCKCMAYLSPNIYQQQHINGKEYKGYCPY